MGLESTIEKLDKYFKRLDKGKARKIKASHVEKVIRKLEAKDESIREDLVDTENPSKQNRLKRKLELVREQKDRAMWLLDEINSG